MRHLPKHTVSSRGAAASSSTQLGQLLNGRHVDLLLTSSEFSVLVWQLCTRTQNARRCQLMVATLFWLSCDSRWGSFVSEPKSRLWKWEIDLSAQIFYPKKKSSQRGFARHIWKRENLQSIHSGFAKADKQRRYCAKWAVNSPHDSNAHGRSPRWPVGTELHSCLCASGVSLHCSGKHSASDPSQCMRAEQSSSMSSPCVRLNTKLALLPECVLFVLHIKAVKITVFALPPLFPGGLSYLDPQSGWHRLVCWSLWRVGKGGTPLAGTASVLVSIEETTDVHCKANKTGTSFEFDFIFTQTCKRW